MSGIGLILNSAKDALLTHQYAINVISHNITNVNTPGYSRQTALINAKTPAPYGGFVFGRGVELNDILRQNNNFIETRLQQRKSALMAMSEKEAYLSVMEGIFNENSELSLGNQFSNFFNSWNDLANAPSGLSERNVVYEYGALLSQSFGNFETDLAQLNQSLSLSIDTAVKRVNQLSSQIADLNEQVFNLGAYGDANDLKDHRDTLLKELSEYIDISTHEDPEGHITLTTSSGYTLVNKTTTYQLSFSGGNIKWEGSGGGEVDITDKITGGKLGGWLDMRDEIIPKYRAEFSELAKSVIWEVNKIHSLGVGLEGFSSVTGTYDADTPAGALDNSGLAYQDLITDGDFKFWVYDSSGNVIDMGGAGGALVVAIDKDVTSINDIEAALDGLDGGNISANVASDGKLTITASNGRTFAFSEDDSHVLAAMGINTFFTGDDAAGMGMNAMLETRPELIAAAKVAPAGGEFAVGDSSNALDMIDLQYQNVTLKRWTYERGVAGTSQDVSNSFENYYHYFVGSIGITSQSIGREKGYSEVVVNQLTDKRNNISAVSIDEEMTDLIKFQHAYSAAAKLVTTANEMLQELLNLK